MNKFTFLALLLTFTLVLSLYIGFGHPGGVYFDIVATSYGLRILRVKGGIGDHVSLDHLSASARLVGPVRELYTINYLLKTSGMNIITVRAPKGVEVGFKIQKRMGNTAEGKFEDTIDPALSVETGCAYIPAFLYIVYLHSNASLAYDFSIYSDSDGHYNYTDPHWIHGTYPVVYPPNDYAKSFSTLKKKLIDNETYVGWKINLSSEDYYYNKTYDRKLEALAIINATLLANKNGKELVLYVKGYAYAVSSNLPTGYAEESNIKIVVNTSGTYAWKNGVLKFRSPSSTIKVKDITGIWDGSPGTVAQAYVDTTMPAEAIVELGNITLSVRHTSFVDGKIAHIKPGMWAFKAYNDTVNLTMYVYPNPVASGYNTIRVNFTKE